MSGCVICWGKYACRLFDACGHLTHCEECYQKELHTVATPPGIVCLLCRRATPARLIHLTGLALQPPTPASSQHAASETAQPTPAHALLGTGIWSNTSPDDIWAQDVEGILEEYLQEFKDADDMRVYAVWGVGCDRPGVYAGPGTSVTDVLFKHAPPERIKYQPCRSITIANKVYRQECDRTGSVQRPEFWGLC